MWTSTLKLLFLLAVLAGASCQHTTPGKNIEERINALEERLHQLEDRADQRNGQAISDDTSNRSSAYTRCLALTKKGHRCKRMIKSGSYCLQHQR